MKKHGFGKVVNFGANYSNLKVVTGPYVRLLGPAQAGPGSGWIPQAGPGSDTAGPRSSSESLWGVILCMEA